VVLLVPLAASAAEPWPLEKLFARPYVWGTSPAEVRWAKGGQVLAFLWNAEGRRFQDLYAYQPAAQRLHRLTDLEHLPEDITAGAAERDEIRKAYLEAPAGITAHHLAHDGTRATFALRGDIWVVKTDGSAPPLRLTRTRGGESSPRLAPDGGRVAYSRDGQLVVHDLVTGQIWQVTDLEAGNTLGAFDWAPDGRQFFFQATAGAGRRLLLPNYSGRMVTAEPFRRTLAGDDPLETTIWIAAEQGGTPRRMDAGPFGAKSYDEAPEWSPDGKKLLWRVVHPNLKRAAVVVFETSTGRATVVNEQHDPKWVEMPFAGWSPDGNRVLFTSEADGWSHLYVAPSRGGEATQITRGRWEIHTERNFSRDPEWAGEHIYYASTEEGTAERQFYRIRPDGSAKEKLSTREGLNIGTVSHEEKHTALMIADLKSPLDLYVDGRRVTTSTRAEFSQYPWPETKFVSFPSAVDGKMVAAKLLLPPGYDPGRKDGRQWPAVFFIHGAGYATSVLKQWGSYVDLRFVYNAHLANKGYVIVDLDYRGSSGYGRDWRTDVYLHLGGRDLEDVLGAVNYVKSLGNIDAKRLGIWGISYGGFMTAMAMFLSPSTFAAGASFASVNDWANYNAGYTEERLTKPGQNPEAYRRSSPIYFSRGLENPFLIVHGMVDDNVLFQDAVQLTEKLIQEGKRFEHFYYPQESHAFVRDETWIDAFRRTTEFFDRNLGRGQASVGQEQ
jgi:dipeptidyl aminopeptidase/acylaminoacyl peptidase